MWLIIPLVYFLGWWQTRSLRQAFNATVAWIVGFSVAAAALLFLDIGGFSGITATPDSPAAGLAFLGGFIAFWISNIIWRRRGGDPERTPGKWERMLRATLGMDEKSKKKKKKRAAQKPAVQPQYQAPPQPLQQSAGAAPVDAQYRPAPHQQAQSAPAQQAAPQFQQAYSAPPAKKTQQRTDTTADKYARATGRALGAMFRNSEPKRSSASQPSSPPQATPHYQQAYPAAPPANQPPQPPAPPARKKQQRRNSPTADKYARATGRALGAMFRSSDKKKSKNSSKR